MQWENWVRNQVFTPARVAEPASEAEVQRLVSAVAQDGSNLRVAGAGHSFSPVVETTGTLMAVGNLRGVTEVDIDARTVTMLPGTRVADLGGLLWEHGLALSNQGDIDTQTLGGAVATGTHGSGITLPSFSATLSRARLVTGTGDVVEVDRTSDPDLLRAAQVAIGTLGVLTSLTLDVVRRYQLREWIGLMPLDDVLQQWDTLVASHRHFSFFWLPDERSAALYGLRVPPDAAGDDLCYVKIYDVPGEGPPMSGAAIRTRVDHGYRVYPSVFDRNFHEMEYMVPVGAGRDTFLAIRDLVRRRFPQCIYPVEVRFTAADDAMLSPNYGTDTAVVSVSGEPGTDYWPFLRACDDVFRTQRGRPHWGKLHFMTAERMDELFPEVERFRQLRAELDPQGVFLNDLLRPLLG